MKGLQDLPAELLICVCEALGGRELRRGKGAAGRITVCRSWYDAALPIYLSGLDVTAVRLYGYNIQTLTEGPSSYATQRRLMHKNTRDLQIRLISHCWVSTGLVDTLHSVPDATLASNRTKAMRASSRLRTMITTRQISML